MNVEELSLEKQQLIDKFSKMSIKIQYYFLRHKLFQPIGIELSSVPIIFEVEETNVFSQLGSINKAIPPAYYRPDTDSIHIFIEHNSFIERNDPEEQFIFLLFLLFHEASHRLFMTMQRIGDREHELWNIATDLEIHNMYYVISELVLNDTSKSNINEFKKYCKYINKFLIEKTNANKNLNEGLFELEFLNNVAEEIYQILLNSKIEESHVFNISKSGKILDKSSSNDDKKSNNGNTDNDNHSSSEEELDSGESIKVTITKYTLPSGKTIQTSNIDFSNVNKKTKSKEENINEENSKNLRKTILQNTLKDELVKSEQRGILSNECKTFLKKILHVKIDWGKILRNSLLSALEKSDYFSWSKPRTSLYGLPSAPYLPSQCMDFEKYGTLIVARDESGSMTDLEVAKAAGIIADAKAHYKKIIIIKHDTKIKNITEIEELDDKAIKSLVERDACGGTSHEEVFKWIRDYYIKTKDSDERISCIISITDLWSDIEDYQNIIPDNLPKIYLTPIGNENKFPKIKGTIIPVEL